MGSPLQQAQIIPARLSFLAIYRPSLSTSDETFANQLVYHFSRQEYEARSAAKRRPRGGATAVDTGGEEENERLRQIGLAQGILDFAKAFSGGQAVDSVESEKSRTVLQELEEGWWILATIELTHVPTFASNYSSTDGKTTPSSNTRPAIEYTSREVSPPALLLAQLRQAHYVFRLHHGPSLSDLYIRLSRERFCGTLGRYWTKFARRWDVLLQGNPAVDIFSGTKLAYGGELGFGVGEEEWGSGEREVLEDMIKRTDGLVDLIVSRFGDSDAENADTMIRDSRDNEGAPWLGQGASPSVFDGVIFGGVGALARSSLRSLSLWMRHIYTYGELAYGVRDNPLRERKKRRDKIVLTNFGEFDSALDSSRDRGAKSRVSMSGQRVASAAASDTTPAATRRKSQKTTSTQMRGHTATEARSTLEYDHIVPPIPPPVATIEPAAKVVTGEISDVGEHVQQSLAQYEHTTLGIPDQYLKYLTFGLSTLGTNGQKRAPTSICESKTQKMSKSKPDNQNSSAYVADDDELSDDGADKATLQHLTPMPDGEALRSVHTIQQRQENKGYFLVGLKGDLDLAPDDTEGQLTDDTFTENHGSRISLRTLHVEARQLINTRTSLSDAGNGQKQAADHDGSKPPMRARVLIYVRRPFIYCLLFESRTSSLQYTKFYRSLHESLVPIQKPLLSSTNPANAVKKIQSLHDEPYDLDSSSLYSMPAVAKETNPCYDLVFNPQLLTLHASVPDIPEPGTLAAEGLISDGQRASSTVWTRAEAVNVHGQLIATTENAKGRDDDIERACKTTRGWWVVWLKFPSSSTPPGLNTARDNDSAAHVSHEVLGDSKDAQSTGLAHQVAVRSRQHRVALLVRKAFDTPATPDPPSASSRAMSGMLNTMTFGLSGQSRIDPATETSDGWGPGVLTGGIGIDARKYSAQIAQLT